MELMTVRVYGDMHVTRRVRELHYVACVAVYVRASMGRRDGLWVRCTDAMNGRNRVTVPTNPVHLVAACSMAVVSSAVTARKTEECHGGHAGRSENDAENVEVHY